MHLLYACPDLLTAGIIASRHYKTAIASFFESSHFDQAIKSVISSPKNHSIEKITALQKRVIHSFLSLEMRHICMCPNRVWEISYLIVSLSSIKSFYSTSYRPV